MKAPNIVCFIICILVKNLPGWYCTLHLSFHYDHMQIIGASSIAIPTTESCKYDLEFVIQHQFLLKLNETAVAFGTFLRCTEKLKSNCKLVAGVILNILLRNGNIMIAKKIPKSRDRPNERVKERWKIEALWLEKEKNSWQFLGFCSKRKCFFLHFFAGYLSNWLKICFCFLQVLFVFYRIGHHLPYGSGQCSPI